MTGLHDESATVTGPADASDEQLLEDAAGGDQGAIAVLYDRYQAMAYGLAMRITGDAGLAQDVMQEAFLGVWRNAARFSRDRASGRTWMMAIVHHRAIDAIRRRRPTVELPSPEAPPPAMVVPDIWHEVAGRLDREAVLRAIATLSAPQREAIELAYFSGLTQQEIAARTDTPLGTVKSRVRLGLLALRAALTADEPPPDQVPVSPEPAHAAATRRRSAPSRFDDQLSNLRPHALMQLLAAVGPA